MTLYDVYACINCGFMNGTKRDFIKLDKGIKICPDCGNNKQEYVQGPTHDKMMGICQDEDDHLLN